MEHLHTALVAGEPRAQRWLAHKADRVETVLLEDWTPDIMLRAPRWSGDWIPLGTWKAEPIVTLREAWGPRSWLVNFGGPYLNDRPPHVELRRSDAEQWPDEADRGRTFLLGAPYRKGRTVRRTVQGLYVAGDCTRPAHLTVHWGDRDAAEFLVRGECDWGRGAHMWRDIEASLLSV